RSVRLVAIGLLPPPIRDAYGFRWDARREFALRLFAWLIRRLLPFMPAAVRYWPAARPQRRPTPMQRMPMLRRWVA
ncbi:MAG TPA: oxygenase MpaB family protein, partial [Chloroflexota bacterium]|nr:oxygenase MpaB family protein [Chloroflexota bacterium]